MEASWSWFGPELEKLRPSWVFLVLAFLFAAETFIEFSSTYPIYRTSLSLGSGAWALSLAIRKKSLIGLLFLPVAGLWLNPLFSGEWFNSLNPISLSAHVALAILFGIAGYSLVAWERG